MVRILRVILIDNESLALEQLKYLLNQFPGIDILATFANPLQAFEQIASLNPDVVFLDMDMPEVHGLTLAEELYYRYKNMAIIFVSAFDEYAISAFEVNALDYILKPISRKRITHTIDKLKHWQNKNIEQDKENIHALSGLLNRNVKKVFARDKDKKMHLLSPESILLFFAQGRDVFVFAKGEKFKTEHTLSYWGDRLATLSFFAVIAAF